MCPYTMQSVTFPSLTGKALPLVYGAFLDVSLSLQERPYQSAQQTSDGGESYQGMS